MEYRLLSGRIGTGTLPIRRAPTHILFTKTLITVAPGQLTKASLAHCTRVVVTITRQLTVNAQVLMNKRQVQARRSNRHVPFATFIPAQSGWAGMSPRRLLLAWSTL